MKSEIEKLLEAKRVERGETKGEFGKLLGFSAFMYEQVLNGTRPIPKKRLEHVAEVLGVPVDRLAFLSKLGKRVLAPDQTLTGDELRYLAGIADAAGVPVRLSLLLEHLVHFSKRTT